MLCQHLRQPSPVPFLRSRSTPLTTTSTWPLGEPHSYRTRRRARCSADGQPTEWSSGQIQPCSCHRRQSLAALVVGMSACATLPWLQSCGEAMAAVAGKERDREKYEPMAALKGKDYGKARQRYPDYVLTNSGLQYQDIREGSGASPRAGSEVAINWDGYTIGYYGRPFEARNKAKGGSFAGDSSPGDLYRFRLGDNRVIPAIEEAVASMKAGGIRRIIVPVELGYPNNDFNQQGPKPSTFSGRRALDFVLKNQGLIDKTLLFDIELVRIL